MTNKTFFQTINNLLNNTARFFRVDLHVHSPESHDFPTMGHRQNSLKIIPTIDRGLSKKDYKKFYKLIEKSKGLSLVAITDHHKSKFSSEVSKLSKDKRVVVLPGMEINVKVSEFTNKKIQLLVIFPQGKNFTDIERIFPAGFEDYEKRNKKTYLDNKIDEIIQGVHSLGGVVIAAHVNDDKGLRKFFFKQDPQLVSISKKIKEIESKKTKTSEEEKRLLNLKKQTKSLRDDIQNRYLNFLVNHEIDAVQIKEPSEKLHYKDDHTKSLNLNPFPCILASDAHNTADIGLNEFCIYVKMENLGIDGLRKAFLDPGVRIKHETEILKSEFSKIKGIQFSGGFFNDINMAFSDNLSCLIGGRGSGKSAIIDAIRYLFNAKLPKEASKRDDVEERQNATLKDTTIKVLFEDESGKEFILEKQFLGSKSDDIRCSEVDGTPRPEIRQSSEKLKIDLYGWGEIELLAKDIDGQIQLIDEAIPDLDERKRKIQSFLSDLKSNTITIVNHAKRINELIPDVNRLEEHKKAREDLGKSQGSVLRKQAKNIQKKEERRDKLEEDMIQIEGLMAEIEGEILNLGKVKIEIFNKENLKSFSGKVSNSFLSKQKKAKELKGRLEKALEFMLIMLGDRAKEKDKKIQKLNQEISDIEDDPKYDQIKQSIGRKKTLNGLINKEIRSKKELEKLVVKIRFALGDRRKKIAPGIMKEKSEVYRLRTSIVNRINEFLVYINGKLSPKNIKIDISIIEGEDKRDFIDAIRKQLKYIQKKYKHKHYAELVAEKTKVIDFYETIVNHQYDRLVSGAGLTIDEAESIINHLYPGNEIEGYDVEKLKSLLEFEECMPGDLPNILYNKIPINKGLSPGQRCTALIPIIFLRVRNVPLIIDQPEDNLDSQLVFDIVVDILRNLKEKRQIIIATHNPNIPVSGDAEQIITLQAVSNSKTEIKKQASIDNDEIISSVKSIMEGGEEAFIIRGRKYQLIP